MSVVAALALVALLGVVAQPAREAYACSLVPFGHQLLPFAIESSTTIAVGRLVDAEQHVITLEVDEGLKGAAPGERLTINNAKLGLGGACEVYELPGGQGFALPEEARVIAFLETNDLGGPAELRSGLYGYGVFVLDGDEIAESTRGASVVGAPTLPEVRDAVRDAGFGPESPGARPSPQGQISGDEASESDQGDRERAVLFLAIAAAVLATSLGTLALIRARR